jgi:hypothetical protein
MRDPSRRYVLTTAASAAAIGWSIRFATAQTAPLPAGRRIALKGYDPVAYFTDGQPAKGVEEFWFAFDDAVYLFRSAAHRARFAAEPERYAPQYDGFCASGVSRGSFTESDPQAWVIANDKLYLLALKEQVPEFKRDSAVIVDKANANWPFARKTR